MSIICLKGFWNLSGNCQEGILTVSGRPLDGVWEMPGSCLEGLEKVSGRCPKWKGSLKY